ncbi:MAG TPA: plastocyanin/azurin family copper-binding protein [Afifellaceae bacterium]|nr:plastocyanin/azurin family copper-binding protein [Afifellaceae bacterium]
MVRFRFAALCGTVFLSSMGGAFAAEHVVTMKGAAYAPPTITAAVGDTVRFVNDDDQNHNVFVPTAGFALDLGKQEPGQEKSYVLGKAGTLTVECVFHSDMMTTMEVK